MKSARNILHLGLDVHKETIVVVIALARQLAIDLWRWRTGHCTPWEHLRPGGPVRSCNW